MDYSANTIKIYKDLEAVMVRPGMYIGDLNTATRQMLYEILDNSLDEIICGHGSTVDIHIGDNIYKIVDNGRGIPVDIHPTEGVSAIELILTKLHAGGKFGNSNYEFSGGLHGVGASVVNALSNKLTCNVFRDNKKYTIEFEKGKIVKPLESNDDIGDFKYDTGTEIIYEPNFDIVEEYIPGLEQLREKFQEIVYLNPGITINLDYQGTKYSFHSTKGIQEYINQLSTNPIIQIYDKDKFKLQDEQTVAYEIIISWNKNNKCHNLNFCNNIKQLAGGTHFLTLKQHLYKYIKQYIFDNLNKTINITAEDIFIGLNWIISVYIPEPQFSSQTKEKLVSKEGKFIIEHFTKKKLTSFFEENPKEVKEICRRIVENAKIRENSNQERNVIDKIANEQSYRLHSKLADCQSNNLDENELFIVEGDSAGGSAKMARDRRYQAILPLRGKLLNVERSTLDKTKSFKELIFLISAIGTGILEKFNIKKLRYGKIILMPDADVDGRHIAALLLNIFMKLTPELFREKRIFVSRPPLYRISLGKKHQYVTDEIHLEEIVIDLLRKKYNISQDIPLVLNEIKKLLNNIQKYKNNEKWSHLFAIPDDILMFYMVYGRDDFVNKMNSSGYSVKFNNDDNKLYVENEYYSKYYILDNLPNIENDLVNLLPFSINNENTYNPMLVYNLLTNHGIKLQRYKGLGEMTAQQLRESCLDPKTRTIEVISIQEDSADVVKEVMGDENRREFILENLKRLFHIDYEQ